MHVYDLYAFGILGDFMIDSGLGLFIHRLNYRGGCESRKGKACY